MNTIEEQEGYLHAPSGVRLYYEIAQPHVERFSDVFPTWEPWQYQRGANQSISPQFIRGECMGDKSGEWKTDGKMAVGPYCSWRDHYDASKAVRCADWVMSRLKERAIIIDNDTISFDIVTHGNGWSLVTAHHSAILGSIWLAYIRTDSIPVTKGACV